ncbi:MAG: CoxE, partial [Solirubrobacteraceae bacterium]
MSIDARLLELGAELRAEGLAVGTSELLDAFAALREIGWSDRAIFHEALAATLAKSPEDRHLFDLVFERFLFRAAEAAALDAGVVEVGVDAEQGAAGQLDLEELRTQIAQALAQGDEGRLADL